MNSWFLWELPAEFQETIRLVCFWSGLAIWVGLAARLLIPARVVKGPWLTLVLGFFGSSLGPLTIRAIFGLERFDPICPAGIIVSILVSVLTLLLFYIVSFLFPADEEDEETKKRALDSRERIERLQREIDRERDALREQTPPR